MAYKFVEEGRQQEALRAVLSYLGITWNDNGRRQNRSIPCPHGCGTGRYKGVSTNLSKGLVNCFHCGKGYNPVSYLAEYRGISLKEAAAIVDELMGYKKGNTKMAYISAKAKEQSKTFVESVKAAPDAEQDKALSLFLSCLPLSEEHKKHLLDRGFTEEEIKRHGYCDFPHFTPEKAEEFAGKLEKAGASSGFCSYDNVRGFYRTAKGTLTFKPSGAPAIAMPLLNRHRQVVGIQYRVDDKYCLHGNKCRWMSSSGENGGVDTRAGIHYACEWIKVGDRLYVPDLSSGIVALTEGYMKADLAHDCAPDMPFIAVPGVNAITYLEEELDYLRSQDVHSIVLCYDMDYETNPNVKKALDKTREVIRSKGMKAVQGNWQKEAEGETLKGIDDSLVYTKRGILPSQHKYNEKELA